MLKRIMVALAGLFLMFGLAATPASGEELDGFVVLYDEFDEKGTSVQRLESQIPPTCSAIPSGISDVRSFTNNTSEPGTTVSLFAGSDTSCSSAIAEVDPGDTDSQIVDLANPSQGARLWMATS